MAQTGESVLQIDSDVHAYIIRELADALDAIAAPHTYRAGELLFRSGEPAGGVLVVRQGKVHLFALEQEVDPALPYRTAGPGYVMGLPALFSGEPYSLTAQAVEDCVCGFVERERALEVVRKRVDLCFQAADLLAREIRSLREWQAAHLGV